MKSAAAIAGLSLAAIPCPAFAELPEGVRAMVDAAVATADPKKVEVVVALARETHPGEVREINLIYQGFLETHRAKQAEHEQRKVRALRNADLFDYWDGKGEIGAFHASGNSPSEGFTGSLSLERVGINWQHKLFGRIDYQRSAGTTSREQYRASYEPNFNFSDKGFVFGLAQYESDRFQGFSSRYSASGGAGYRLLEEDDLSLSVKGGPAWRTTYLTPTGKDSYVAGLAAMDLDWKITSRIDLTQEASAFVRTDNSSFTSLTGLEAGIGGGLKARVSYAFQHETDPPDGALQTDTLSRFTLIYDF